jgi:hypothetical protein
VRAPRVSTKESGNRPTRSAHAGHTQRPDSRPRSL